MKVLIFTSRLGSGHLSISQLIQELIKSKSPRSTIETFNTSTAFASHAYRIVGTHLNNLLANIWELSDNHDTSLFVAKLYHLVEGEKVGKIINKLNPDIIISTDSISPFSIQENLKSFNKHIPHLVTVADPITLHHLWTADSRADMYIAPIKETVDILISRNIPKNKITLTGYPVRLAFYKTLTISAEPNTIFIGGSGEGHGNIYKLIKEIQKKYNKFISLRLIVVCGKNKDLYKKLKKLKTPKNLKIIPYKYVKNIDQLIRKSQFVVGKPGPNILFESIILDKPFIAIGNPLLQEMGNYNYIDNNNIGSSAINTKFAAEKIINLLNNQDQLKNYKKNTTVIKKNLINTPEKIWKVIEKFTK